MALFGVTRFTGDEYSDREKEKESRSSVILKKLHQQAAERKQQKTKSPKRQLESTKELSPGNLTKKQRTGEEDPSDLFGGQEESRLLTDASPKSQRDKPSKKKKKKSDADIIVQTSEDRTVSKKDRKNSLVTEGDGNNVRSPYKQEELKKKKKKHVAEPQGKSNRDKDLVREGVNTKLEDDDDEKEPEHDVAEEESVSGDEGQEEIEEESYAEGQSHMEIGGFTVVGDVHNKDKKEVKRVLPNWLAKPSVISADIRRERAPLSSIEGLDDDMLQKLKKNGIVDFFPVQTQLLPVLLEGATLGHTMGRAGYRPCDVCCSAPTGSGKTLAFVLPIVQVLKQRVVCRVRALIVLPVRDLATQVYKVFLAYCKDTNVKVGLIIGQKPFASEQKSLVKNGIRGYESLVDVIVATPGRLVDHINQTPGFCLKALRFLVIDEADRMMDEISQDWLTYVEQAVYQGASSEPASLSTQGEASFSKQNFPSRQQPGALIANSSSLFQIPLQKLLFSATLSQNPEKLQQLSLFQPKLFTSVVSEASRGRLDSKDETLETAADDNVAQDDQGAFIGKFTTPAGLTEYMIQCKVAEKPLVMLYLLQQLQFHHVLCFTNSLQTNQRLCWLLKLVGGIEVAEVSSNLQPHRRNQTLKKFAAGKIDVLVCSDAMARGMDVENAQYVVSYEPPPYLKTYIHRVGRTARAGRTGTAITLLEKKEIFHFKKMLQEAGKTELKEMKVKQSDLKPHVSDYQEALSKLQDVLKADKRR